MVQNCHAPNKDRLESNCYLGGFQIERVQKSFHGHNDTRKRTGMYQNVVEKWTRNRTQSYVFYKWDVCVCVCLVHTADHTVWSTIIFGQKSTFFHFL